MGRIINEVSDAFDAAVSGLTLNGTSMHYSRDYVTAVITDWKVRRHGKGYAVKITRMETPEGVIDETTFDLCPHKYLTEVLGLADTLEHSVLIFRKQHNVRLIESPHCECDHFSDMSFHQNGS